MKYAVIALTNSHNLDKKVLDCLSSPVILFICDLDACALHQVANARVIYYFLHYDEGNSLFQSLLLFVSVKLRPLHEAFTLGFRYPTIFSPSQSSVSFTHLQSKLLLLDMPIVHEYQLKHYSWAENLCLCLHPNRRQLFSYSSF